MTDGLPARVRRLSWPVNSSYMAVLNYKNIEETDLDQTVWRYLTFSKYISLITYRALWFSKLNIFTDRYEGAMPTVADAGMLAEHQKLTRLLDPSMHEQIDDMNKKNVEDGRELIVTNCWFISEFESERMWEQYAKGPEGIAIKSSIRLLSEYIFAVQG
jgi:hypothetical protein